MSGGWDEEGEMRYGLWARVERRRHHDRWGFEEKEEGRGDILSERGKRPR